MARVSALWIRTTAKKLAIEDYPDSPFKASNGWLFRFLRRHKIRYRKRKNQKAVSAEGKGLSYKNGIRRYVMKYYLFVIIMWEAMMADLGDSHQSADTTWTRFLCHSLLNKMIPTPKRTMSMLIYEELVVKD